MSAFLRWIFSWPKKKTTSEDFARFGCFFTECLWSCASQGDAVRKGQLNERREPGHRLWPDAHAAAGAERPDHPERHEAAEAGGAAHDRARRRLILRTDAGKKNEGQLFILSKRKSKPPLILMKFPGKSLWPNLNLKRFSLAWPS